MSPNGKVPGTGAGGGTPGIRPGRGGIAMALILMYFRPREVVVWTWGLRGSGDDGEPETALASSRAGVVGAGSVFS